MRELVTIFAGPLASVSFPGVDGGALAALVTQVDDDAAELARLDAAAAALRQRLTDGRDDLHLRAHRALAYARVYADGDGSADLAARLDALVLPRSRTQRPPAASAAATAEAAPRKRGRPRKDLTPTTLFASPPTTPPSA
ncbi:MAG: hypothetical protein IPL61_35780 [Myxococcales bacterium]|nr:hypothetical protein [Myxococcales bacterium]